MKKNVAFIGAGSMAEAIISGMIKHNLIKSDQVYVTNKSNRERLHYLKDKYNVHVNQDIKRTVEFADIIILLVKPNDIKQAINSFKNFIHADQLIITVVAGVTTETIEAEMNKKVPVIRSMPNTSASIGYSATAISKGTFANEKHMKLTTLLFNTIGKTVVVAEEKMDIVTGLSGSGPAYIYYLVEAMERVAVESGLDLATAKLIIPEVIIGAGKMLEQSKKPAAKLRQEVTSPGGTTEAGIKTLEKYNYQEAIMECVKSATSKASELGSK